MSSRAGALREARAALAGAHRDLHANGLLEHRRRRVEALGGALAIREEKGAGADEHLRAADEARPRPAPATPLHRPAARSRRDATPPRSPAAGGGG